MVLCKQTVKIYLPNNPAYSKRYAERGRGIGRDSNTLRLLRCGAMRSGGYRGYLCSGGGHFLYRGSGVDGISGVLTAELPVPPCSQYHSPPLTVGPFEARAPLVVVILTIRSPYMKCLYCAPPFLGSLFRSHHTLLLLY